MRRPLAFVRPMSFRAAGSHCVSSSGLLVGPEEPACQLGLVRVIGQPQDLRPELLRRLLQVGQVSGEFVARRLYASGAFVACGPFGTYTESPRNYFMTRRRDP